ncbi:hypothetical protein [Actinobacillus equuli]|uniref:Uncharacterized protein n=2 Tax=Actinobacillus TaxID=713 RepID=A0AAX3FLM8_ACTEU|nr:hypothetical protein [Actinobacillus equuli]WGE45013.1 hypothetical protein NYR65_02940 [Actinobacillus equuli subsp. equuli]VEE92978.1 Uncharacterised protein [Actinobacillus equuli]
MTAEQVWQMPVLEVFAWIESYLEMEGIKTPHGSMGANNVEVKHESYVFTRRGKINK